MAAQQVYSIITPFVLYKRWAFCIEMCFKDMPWMGLRYMQMNLNAEPSHSYIYDYK